MAGKGSNVYYTEEVIRRIFDEQGLLLLENEVVNSKVKIKYTCKLHPTETFYSKVKSIIAGYKCVYCSGSRIHINFAKEEFRKRDMILLEDKFINAKVKMKYICLIHNHESHITWDKFLSGGNSCKYCIKIKRNINSKKVDVSVVIQEFEKRNLIMVGEYVSNKNKIKYICPLHPDKELYTTYGNLRNIVYGCPYCSSENRCGENNHNWQGGLSTISEFLRNKLDHWKQKSKIESGYKCVVTGDKFDTIHHLYSFNKIVKETLSIINIEVRSSIADYSENELCLIVETFRSNHDKYPLGVCLKKDVHDLFHKIYGKENNNPEQFEEFRNNFISGKICA